ncbi:UDP-N-acetylmuramoyl-L-alanine--D-glutamate ligase [Candidatus Saccharibacteria bacterium]|nr:UDP-N-acetylmuramoyl-L-alanine--D-glutamate ligase [Candidatus Saccharibacteria bacterium]
MRIAIVGFDVEGRSTYDFFAAQGGHELVIHDQNPDLVVPDGALSVLGPGYLSGLSAYDLVVRTPGLHPSKLPADAPVTTNLNLFFEHCPSGNVLAITGTKGKGTTSSLVTAMLQADGRRVHLGGNIGVAPLAMLQDIQPDDWVVLELSNFQLIDCRHSPALACCLMIASEHMDWHPNLEEYITAKQQLFRWQKPEDRAIYYADNQLSQRVVSVSPGQKIPYWQVPGAYVDGDNIVIDGQIICSTQDVKLVGWHNQQNVCAALTTVWQVCQNVPALHEAISSFSGLEHRIEFVRKINGVSYYNDSFGTTPETAQVAIEAFAQPKVLILGGSDKGADYNTLAQTIANANIRRVLLIGEQAGRLQNALDAAGFTNYEPGGTSMPEIVAKTAELAQDGDIVLLSTACASFDMFKNYKDRGQQFKQAVLQLPA